MYCNKLELRDVIRQSEEAEAEAACLRERVRHVSQPAVVHAGADEGNGFIVMGRKRKRQTVAGPKE